jgi:hypothetical protein
MRRKIFFSLTAAGFALALIFILCPLARCQVDSMIYLKQFAGRANTVGGLVALAMPSCPGRPGSSVVPCILVADPSLAAWSTGTIPTLCTSCYLWDWRNGPPGGASGGVTQIVPGTNITVSPSGGTGAVTVNAAGGGSSPIPANARFVFVGDSRLDDDLGVLSNARSISTWSTTSGITTVNAATAYAPGEWVSMRNANGWPTPPTRVALGTGYTLFQVLSVTFSSFTINTSSIAAGACASSCGTVTSAANFLPFQTVLSAGFPSSALNNVYVYVPNPANIQTLVVSTAITTQLSALEPSATGVPAYLTIVGGNNDLEGSCISATTLEGAYSGLFSWAADGYKVVSTTLMPVSASQQGAGCNFYSQAALFNQWLADHREVPNGSNAAGGWNIFSDLGTELADGKNTDLVATNGGFGPGGVSLAASRLGADIFVGSGLPLPKSNCFFGVPAGSSFSTGLGHTGAVNASWNGFVCQPSADGYAAYTWADSNGQPIFSVDTQSPATNTFGYSTQFVPTSHGVGNATLGYPGAQFAPLGYHGYWSIPGTTFVPMTGNSYLWMNFLYDTWGGDGISAYNTSYDNGKFGWITNGFGGKLTNGFILTQYGGDYDNLHTDGSGQVCVGVLGDQGSGFASSNQCPDWKTGLAFEVGPGGNFAVDFNGNATAVSLSGPDTAPSGTCSVDGQWEFSKDGHATVCVAGTWTTKI